MCPDGPDIPPGLGTTAIDRGFLGGCKVESIYLNVEAVNTHREKPEVGKGLCGSSWGIVKAPSPAERQPQSHRAWVFPPTCRKTSTQKCRNCRPDSRYHREAGLEQPRLKGLWLKFPQACLRKESGSRPG